jgi:hypothetical protein
MKHLRASARMPVPVSAAGSLALLRELERYPEWYPEGVRSVVVLERSDSGVPRRVRALLRLAQGPLQRDFEVVMVVSEPAPGTLVLEREPHGPSDLERFAVAWRAEEGSLALALEAELAVPRLLPLGGAAEALAEGFLAAAARALASR